MLNAVSGFRDGTELVKWRFRIVLKVTSLRVTVEKMVLVDWGGAY